MPTFLLALLFARTARRGSSCRGRGWKWRRRRRMAHGGGRRGTRRRRRRR
uniref:Uncharacterized protein n=1 Tax=Arundo donax TaxID=35708 RepID=A0A0A9HN32_ARUDO